MVVFDQEMREILALDGVISVCLVRWDEERALRCYGADDTARAAQTAAVVRAVVGNPLWEGSAVEDVVITEGGHHLLYAVLDPDGLCVQVRMDREGSLALVRHRLRFLAGQARTPSVPDIRRERGTPAPEPVTTVERPVLIRVLNALRELSIGNAQAGEVVA